MRNCCLTACERWKQERRGYVPMDIFNAQQSANNYGCNCNCGCNCGNRCYNNVAEETEDFSCENSCCN